MADGIFEGINGIAEWYMDSPGELNLRWTTTLAITMLAAREAVDRHQRLPTDVFAVVAEILVGDRDLHTICQLNLASRHMHEVTLPVLYETLIFADENAFELSAQFTNPKGWRYVKFLFVTEITLPPILRIHLRYQSHYLPTPRDDLPTFFPRLTLMGLEVFTSSSPPPANHGRPLHVTLYRPMRFSSLLRVCLPYGPLDSVSSITFFGTHYSWQTIPRRPLRVRPHFFRDIVGLDVQSGAWIVRGRTGWTATAMKGWQWVYCGTKFRLDITGGIFEAGVKDTLQTVVDHLMFHTSSKSFVATGKEVNFQLYCPQSVFEKFIELMSIRTFVSFGARQPCFINLHANLTNAITKRAIKHYISTLSANYYQRHWRHRALTFGYTFISILAPAHTIPHSWIQHWELENHTNYKDYRVEWAAGSQIGLEEGIQSDGEVFGDAEEEEEAVDEFGLMLPSPGPDMTFDLVHGPESTNANNHSQVNEGAATFALYGPPNADHPATGFTAYIHRQLMHKDTQEDYEYVYEWSYPVAPPPTVPETISRRRVRQ
ncbi:hypothetical protein QFC22_004739 [Naganishia vaughanmartiniae]|uniref:Uncharacterized protein n=1 Tax=Naganishia vaughanmartiniae TaxID=1424756 RepID=A0ACC2WYQ7_9TREE|nr:hypothetical protein QFC22_004739 [Naganishia vaughanmartiniae]